MDTNNPRFRGDAPASPQKYVPTHRWARGPAPALSVAARWLAIERRKAGEPVKLIATRFPHALNAIAEAWDDPARTLQVIDELLGDARGGRRGLPTVALAEALSLRLACEARLAGAEHAAGHGHG